MNTLLHDLRFGARLLLKSPSFTSVAILTLALGIGANTAIFSAVNAVLLRPLAYPNPDRLAMLWLDNRRLGLHEDLTSYPNFADWRSQSRLFEDMDGFTPVTYNVTGDGEPYGVRGVRVGARVLRILGVVPARGRIFSGEEEQRGHHQVVILSDGIWRERFGGDPAVLGKTIQLDGENFGVVGVMPPGFRFPDKQSQIWTPLAVSDRTKSARGAFWMSVIGRLKPGASLEQARAEMNAIGSRLEQQYPDTNRGYGVWVAPLLDHVVGNLRASLWILFGAVGFVLLIACANVANLFLARAAGREREIAIRAALGAGRGGLIRQLLTESLVFAAPAGALGLAIAYAGLRGLVALAPRDMPRLDEIGIDGRVLLFTAAVSLLSALFFGIVPALRVSRSDLNEGLREGGRSIAGGRRTSLARSSLTVAEVALSMVLLAGAGLLIRSLIELNGLNPGFQAGNVLTMLVSPAPSKITQGSQAVTLYQGILDRVQVMPNVRSAGLISDIFLSATPNSGGFTVEGHPLPPPEQRIEATVDAVSNAYFRTMGVKLVAGRFFGEQDQSSSPRVALINETMARRFWPNEDPVGKRFRFGWENSTAPWLTVAGVVGDMRRQGLDKQARSETFMPLTQRPRLNMNLVIRTVGDPLKLAGAIRSEIRGLDKDIVLEHVSTLEQQLGESLAPRRFQTLLLVVLSGAALLLAAIGIYGVLYHSVTQRTHEFGVRLALGARGGDLVRMVIAQAATLVLAGAVLGTLASLALTRTLASVLYGVSAADPVTYLVVLGVLFVSALLASYLPARRATSVDPVRALRYE